MEYFFRALRELRVRLTSYETLCLRQRVNREVSRNTRRNCWWCPRQHSYVVSRHLLQIVWVFAPKSKRIPTPKMRCRQLDNSYRRRRRKKIICFPKSWEVSWPNPGLSRKVTGERRSLHRQREKKRAFYEQYSALVETVANTTTNSSHRVTHSRQVQQSIYLQSYICDAHPSRWQSGRWQSSRKARFPRECLSPMQDSRGRLKTLSWMPALRLKMCLKFLL